MLAIGEDDRRVEAAKRLFGGSVAADDRVEVLTRGESLRRIEPAGDDDREANRVEPGHDRLAEGAHVFDVENAESMAQGTGIRAARMPIAPQRQSSARAQVERSRQDSSQTPQTPLGKHAIGLAQAGGALTMPLSHMPTEARVLSLAAELAVSVTSTRVAEVLVAAGRAAASACGAAYFFRGGDTLTVASTEGIPGAIGAVGARLDIGDDHPVANAVRGGGAHVFLDANAATATFGSPVSVIGIAASGQARIFERFGRAVSSQHYSVLGLWVARRIVLAHNGEIVVRSSPGEGSESVVRLARDAEAFVA